MLHIISITRVNFNKGVDVHTDLFNPFPTYSALTLVSFKSTNPKDHEIVKPSCNFRCPFVSNAVAAFVEDCFTQL